MFEKMVLLRSEDGGGETLGEIAEGLLFYQQVHLILDRSTVINLVAKIGMDQLLNLLSRPGMSAVYCREMLGTMVQQVGALTHHSFVGMEIRGQASGRPLKYLKAKPAGFVPHRIIRSRPFSDSIQTH